MLFVVGPLLCPTSHHLRLLTTCACGGGGVSDGKGGAGAMGGHGVLPTVGTHNMFS